MTLFLDINGQKHTPLEAVRLGQKLYAAGKVREAFTLFSGVLKVAPTNVEALVAAGQCHLRDGNWTEALAHASLARQADKSFLGTYHLAIVAMKNLPLQKSRVWTDNGLAEHPDDPTLLLQRAMIASDADDHEGVRLRVARILATDTHFKTPLMAISLLGSNFPAREWAGLLASMPVACPHPLVKLAVQSRLLISLWLKGDRAGLDSVLGGFIPALTKMKADNNLLFRNEAERNVLSNAIQNANGYGLMFEQLANLPAPTAPAGLPTLHMVGDSHVMPQHGQVVPFNGRDHVVRSDVSVGVKLWHLVAPDDHIRLRKVVRDIVRGLPEGEPVAFSIGEIDARADEGLWPLLAKGTKPLNDLLRDTCGPAFTWLKNVAGSRPVIICGIPAPARRRDASKFSSTSQHDEYARMVGALNTYMAKLAASNGWTFADLHALTVGADGLFSSEDWHLEDTHLKPGALAAALAI